VIRVAADGIKEIATPLTDADVESLKSGDRVRIIGVLLTARDAAHGRLNALLDEGKPLPIDVKGQIIYYTGPTTGGRMDRYAPRLLALGLKGMMGKGARSEPVREAMKRHKAVYFGAVGGAGAFLSRYVKKVEIVAYEDLGTEAIRRMEVDGFPAIVVNDCHGNDLYQEGMKAYAR
jgi:fumarate hydratase subunit beta